MPCHDPATLADLAHYVGKYLRHNEHLTASCDAMDDYSDNDVKHQRRRHLFQDLTVRRDAMNDCSNVNVVHQRRQHSLQDPSLYKDSSARRSHVISRAPSGGVSRASTSPSEKHGTSSTHDVPLASLRRGSDSTKPKTRNARSTVSSTVGSILESTLRAGVVRRAIPTHSCRLADPALDTISGASRFYASSLQRATEKKKQDRYRPDLAQIKERGNMHTLWQNTCIIVCLVLIPICLLIACLAFLFVLDDEPPAAIYVANITTREIVGNTVRDSSWNNLTVSRIVVLLQVLVLPYIFPTPFGLIVRSFQSKKED